MMTEKYFLDGITEALSQKDEEGDTDFNPISNICLGMFRELNALRAALLQFYEPHEDCKESQFTCDYRIKGFEDCCPCEYVKRIKLDSKGKAGE